MSQWSPTHVEVTAVQATSLIAQGRTAIDNDAYVIIQLGKDKFQTSVAEKTLVPKWNESCDLRIVDLTESIVLTVYRKRIMGADEFLGQVELPLQELNFYDRPKNMWYPLRSKKKDQAKDEKYRGEILLRLNFYIQNVDAVNAPNLMGNDAKKDTFRSKIVDHIGKTLPKRKHSGSLTKIGSDFFSSLPRLRLKARRNQIAPSIGISPLEMWSSGPQKRVPMIRVETPAPRQLTPKIPITTSSHNCTVQTMGDDESFTSSTYENHLLQDNESLDASSVSRVRASSFSKAVTIITSLIPSGANGGSSNFSRRRAASALGINSITAEPKLSSILNQHEKSPSMINLHEKCNSPMRGLSTEDIEFVNFKPPITAPTLSTTVHVPTEFMRRYGQFEKAELMIKLGHADEKLAELDRLYTYIDSLLVRVLETAPQILQRK